jgi:hypothetical protein
VSLSAGEGVFIEGSSYAFGLRCERNKALKLDENYYKFNDFILPMSPAGDPALGRTVP